MKEFIINFLVKMVSNLLQVEPTQLEINTDLSDYGIGFNLIG